MKVQWRSVLTWEFWLPVGHSFDLGVARATSFAIWTYCCLRDPYFSLMDHLIDQVPNPEHFWNPQSFFVVLRDAPVTMPALRFMDRLLIVFVVLAAIGLFTRLSCLIAGFLLLTKVGLGISFLWFTHKWNLPILMMFIFSASPSGESFSVDSLIRRWKNKSEQDLPAPSSDFGWPLHLICCLFGMVFFAAGLSKLRHSGMVWMSPAQFQNRAIGALYGQSDVLFGQPGRLDSLGRSSALALVLSRSGWLPSVAGFLSLVIELSAPLIVFGKFRKWGVAALALFQISNWLVITQGFLPFLSVYFCLVPWEKVHQKMMSVRGFARLFRQGFYGREVVRRRIEHLRRL